MKFIEERPNETGVSQYHFNTSKLNDYLTKKSEQMGCEIIDDEVDPIWSTEIKYLKGQKQDYH